MTTTELIKELQEADPAGDREVVLQIDPEGNGYHLVRGADGNAAFRSNDGYNVEVGRQEITDELKDLGFTEEDLGNGLPCVVIFP
jgi:hypothetical protein